MATSKLRQTVRNQKEDLQKRHSDAVDRKDTGRFGSIFLRNKIPDGVKFWSISNDVHLIDIIPFIAGPNHPDPNTPEGRVTYSVDLWRHRNVGANDASYVCPAKTWNKPCPICEDLSGGDFSDADFDNYKAKRVCCYLVWVHTTPKEEKQGLMILELPYFFLQKHLDELAVSPRGGGVLPFSDVDDGKSIAFSKSGGKSNWTFIGHRFENRVEPIPDEICDQSFTLDDCIHLHPEYDEIADSWFGPPPKEEKDKETPQKETPQRTEEPAQHRGQARQEEAEQRFGGGHECPAGGVFGADTDNLDQCSDCTIWDDCFANKQNAENLGASTQSTAQEQSEQSGEERKPRRIPRRRANK